MFNTEIAVHYSEIEKHKLELAKCQAALQSTEMVIDAVDAMVDCEANAKAIRMGMDVVASQVGFESHEDLLGERYEAYLGNEVAMEGIRELPMRIYRAVAKILGLLMDKIRSLYHAIFRKNQTVLEQTSARVEKFEVVAKDTKKAITDLKFEIGEKLSKEQQALVKENEMRLFLSIDGRVLDPDEVLGNVTVLASRTALRDEGYLSVLHMRGSYTGLVENARSVMDYVSGYAGKNLRSSYAELAARATNIENQEDFDWFFNVGLPNVERENDELAKAMKIDPRRGTARPILGEIVPTMKADSTSTGPVKVKGVLMLGIPRTGAPASKIPNGYPELSFEQVKSLVQEISRLESKRVQVTNQISAEHDNFRRFTNDSGKALAEADARSKRFYNNRNSQDIKKFERYFKTFPGHLEVALDHLAETALLLNTYVSSMAHYVNITIGSIEEFDKRRPGEM